MSCTRCQQNTETIDNRADMLSSYDWLNDIPDTSHLSNIVEIRFKGTHKDYFRNSKQIDIKRGDTVVVDANGGHDAGIVSLTGKLAEKQYNLKVKNKERHRWFEVYRKAYQRDIERWNDARKREKPVMIRARQIAKDLELEMKIGEVELRGDGQKAIFYYIAEGRVDFRELIKHYAREFNIKIEMKQIGARQEAALIGGIGSCGRELCCSSWRTDFSSINSHMATRQGLSPNAEKLTGRCGKLKCCLMYELDNYLEAQKNFPPELLVLETNAGNAKHFKIDILKKQVWYSIEKDKTRTNFVLSVEKVKEIINLNKRGTKPDLAELTGDLSAIENESANMFGKNLTSDKKTFSQKKKKNSKGRKNRKKRNYSRTGTEKK